MTEAVTMTKEGRALTVADYEARIHLYKEQIGFGYIGIGRTLNEAKEAGVVPAGQWEAWVTDVTGLTVRQAQRCMQAAREIRDGSALARLEMSKAMRLLSSGLDEEQREELAEKASQDELTVKELEAEIRKLKTGQEQAVELARDWEKRAREAFAEGQKSARRAEDVEENLRLVEANEKVRQARARSGELELKLDEMRGQLHEAQQAAERAERLYRDLQANQSQKTAEEYYKGRNEGMAETQQRLNREKADWQEANERMQRTIDEQQARIDEQQNELNEMRRRDRQARMAAARGTPVANGPDGVFCYNEETPVSGLILQLISKTGAIPPAAYRGDAALPGELQALEQWIGRVRGLIGVRVEGVIE